MLKKICFFIFYSISYTYAAIDCDKLESGFRQATEKHYSNITPKDIFRLNVKELYEEDLIFYDPLVGVIKGRKNYYKYFIAGGKNPYLKNVQYIKIFGQCDEFTVLWRFTFKKRNEDQYPENVFGISFFKLNNLTGKVSIKMDFYDLYAFFYSKSSFFRTLLSWYNNKLYDKEK